MIVLSVGMCFRALRHLLSGRRMSSACSIALRRSGVKMFRHMSTLSGTPIGPGVPLGVLMCLNILTTKCVYKEADETGQCYSSSTGFRV
jgi:hypothetical protein